MRSEEIKGRYQVFADHERYIGTVVVVDGERHVISVEELEAERERVQVSKGGLVPCVLKEEGQ